MPPPKLDPVEALLRKRQRDREYFARRRQERNNVTAIIEQNRQLLEEKKRSDDMLQQHAQDKLTATATSNQLCSLLNAQLTSAAAGRADASRRQLAAAKLADDQSAELAAMQNRLSAERRRTMFLTKNNARLQSALESESTAKSEAQLKLVAMEKQSKKRRHATIGERQDFLSRFDDLRRLDPSMADSAIISTVDSSLPLDTAFKWLRNRASIDGHVHSKKMRSTVKSKHLAVDAFVLSRLRQLVGTDMIHLPVTLAHIITLAEWGCINHNDDFTPTIDWARAFCKRNGLVCRKLTGTRSPKAPDKETISAHMSAVFSELVSLGFNLDQVWCGDEISFKSKMLRQTGFVFEDGEKLPLSKAVLDNTAFTALLFFNFVQGTRRPAVIWHGKDKPLAAGVTLIRGETVPPTDLAQNKTAWMRRDIFAAVLKAWDDELVRDGAKAALIVDNVSTHHGEGNANIGEAIGLKNLLVRYLLPNTTDVAQLNDTGCNRSVQAAKVRLYSNIVLHAFFSGEKERLTCARGVKMLHAAVDQVDPLMPGRVARHLFGDLLDVFL